MSKLDSDLIHDSDLREVVGETQSGEAVASLEPAGEDDVAQRDTQLGTDGSGCAMIEVDRKQQRAACLLHHRRTLVRSRKAI